MADVEYRERMSIVIRDFQNTGRSSFIAEEEEIRNKEAEALRIMSGDEGPELRRVLELIDVPQDHQLAKLEICKYVLQRNQTMSFIYLASEMEEQT